MSGTGGAGSSINSVANFVAIIANLFVVVAVGVSLISLTLSFIKFVTSTGDPKAVEKAKSGVLWGILGLLISLLAFTIKDILVRSVGITGIK